MEMPNPLYKTAQVESLQQTAMLNQQPAVLHRSPALHNGDKCRTAPEQTPHRNPEEGSASEPAEHNLCAAVLNSGKLLEPPRFLLQHPRPACSLPPPPPADLTAARRRRGNPRSGLASAMALSGSTSRVVGRKSAAGSCRCRCRRRAAAEEAP